MSRASVVPGIQTESIRDHGHPGEGNHRDQDRSCYRCEWTEMTRGACEEVRGGPVGSKRHYVSMENWNLGGNTGNEKEKKKIFKDREYRHKRANFEVKAHDIAAQVTKIAHQDQN